MKEFSLEEARKLGEEWKKVLNLEPYEIKIDKMPLAEVNQQKGPDESFVTFGLCSTYLPAMQAYIFLLDPNDEELDEDEKTRERIAETYDMEKTLVHEILHIYAEPFYNLLESKKAMQSQDYVEGMLSRIGDALVDLKRKKKAEKKIAGIEAKSYSEFDSVYFDEEALHDAVRFWLPILRLNNWSVAVRFCEQEEFGEANNPDSCDIVRFYAQNRINQMDYRCNISMLTAEQFEEDAEMKGFSYDMEQSLVHELLHLHGTYFDTIINSYGKDNCIPYCAFERFINMSSRALVEMRRR